MAINKETNNNTFDKTMSFIEKYKELENAIENRYNLKQGESPVFYLENRPEYSQMKDKISYCREVRNFLQHENMISNNFAITPSDEMINLITKIIEIVKNPKKAKDICKRIQNVYYKELNDNVFDSMMAMNHRKYSHIPILNNGVVIGVFSKSTVFNYLLDIKEFEISKKLTFRDIKNRIEINIDNSEKYVFISEDASIEHVKDVFENSYKNAMRIAMAFVTKNGLQNEKLIGIITPYDLIN